jgi:hypothetical protein
MAQDFIALATGQNVATESATYDGVKAHAQLMQIADIDTGNKLVPDVNGAIPVTLPATAAKDGTDGTGITPPTGATGIRGWLSGIYHLLSNPLSMVLAAGANLIGGVNVVDAAGTNKLAVDASGKVGINNFPASQPISGTVAVSALPVLPAGTNAIGHVTVDAAPAQVGPGYNSTGTGQFVPCADAGAAINCGAAATQTLVSGVAGKRILVCAFNFIANGTGTVQFAYGATPTLIGGAWAVTAETGLAQGCGYGIVMLPIPAAQDLKIITTGTATAQGFITHTQAV